jgi:hypothetical protein
MDKNNLSENDQRQIMIIRQSQLKLALDWSQLQGHKLSLLELTRLTSILTDYVIDGSTNEINTSLVKVDEYLKKK